MNNQNNNKGKTVMSQKNYKTLMLGASIGLLLSSSAFAIDSGMVIAPPEMPNASSGVSAKVPEVVEDENVEIADSFIRITDQNSIDRLRVDQIGQKSFILQFFDRGSKPDLARLEQQMKRFQLTSLTIDMRGFQVSRDDMVHLMGIIESQSKLNSLAFLVENGQWGDAGFEDLNRAIKSRNSLQQLTFNFGQTVLNAKAVELICDAIAHHSASLQDLALYLRDTKLDSASIAMITKTLEKTTHLKALDFDFSANTSIQDVDVINLSSAIAKLSLSKYFEIDLSETRITDAAVRSLTMALEKSINHLENLGLHFRKTGLSSASLDDISRLVVAAKSFKMDVFILNLSDPLRTFDSRSVDNLVRSMELLVPQLRWLTFITFDPKTPRLESFIEILRKNYNHWLFY